MKKLCYWALVMLLSWTMALSVQASSGNFDLTSDQWRQDLKWLSNTVHHDYSFLFKKISAEDWDKHVVKLYNQIPEMEDHEVIVGMARLIASFGWGHSRLDVLPFGPFHNPAKFKRMPYNLYYFSDGVYVQGTLSKFAEAVGARVIAIGGTPIEQALELVRPVVPAENEMFFRAYGLQYLQIPEILHAQGITKDLSKTTLTLEKDGKRFEITYPYGVVYEDPYYDHSLVWKQDGRDDWVVARSDEMLASNPLWLKHADQTFWFEQLPGRKVVYAQQNLVRDSEEETLAHFYARLFEYIEDNQIEKLIIDLRLNGGGDNFLNVAPIQQIVRSDQINQPGNLFVVIGRRTFSACQNFVNELETYTEAIFVGEPTGENVNMYGDNREIKLPNSGITGRLSWAWWQDKPQWDTRQWTAPVLAADLSFQDYMQNVDPVLEVIEQYTGTGDPRDHMRALFDSGKMEELLKVSKEYIQDPAYRYIAFETEINDAGYQLLRAGRKEEAKAVFKLNTELYPESANVWDSYAEVHLEMMDIDRAVEFYHKAKSMDPDGFAGQHAEMMLNKIKGIAPTEHKY
jgi:tetratricopeptide (TPR) repeat protein